MEREQGYAWAKLILRLGPFELWRNMRPTDEPPPKGPMFTVSLSAADGECSHPELSGPKGWMFEWTGVDDRVRRFRCPDCDVEITEPFGEPTDTGESTE